MLKKIRLIIGEAIKAYRTYQDAIKEFEKVFDKKYVGWRHDPATVKRVREAAYAVALHKGIQDKELEEEKKAF